MNTSVYPKPNLPKYNAVELFGAVLPQSSPADFNQATALLWDAQDARVIDHSNAVTAARWFLDLELLKQTIKAAWGADTDPTIRLAAQSYDDAFAKRIHSVFVAAAAARPAPGTTQYADLAAFRAVC